MTTVLVTCVGSGVGQSVLDSLNLTREFRIIGCDGNRNVYAHSFCDKFYVVPGLYSEGYTDYILNLCVENNVKLLIPGHDHELVLFGKNLNKFVESGIQVIVSNPNIIAVSRDKQDWYNFFAPLGCKIVPTISVKEYLEHPDTDILPAIVKPSGGSASQGITIVNSPEEVEGLNLDDIIQPYLFPEETDLNYNRIVEAVRQGNFLQVSEISIQLIFDRKSKFSGIFISKNSLKNGVPIFIDPIDPSSFKYIDEILKFVPILEREGVRGPVNIQGRITPKGLYFFEMNMRFTGITGNRALLGFNEVNFLVKNFLNEEASLEGYAYNKVGVRQVACSTIPKDKTETQEVLTILGAGSNIGRTYLVNLKKFYKEINLIVRPESKEKYQNLFGNMKVKLINDNSPNLHQILCQTDVLINFVSALAYEPDERKFEAIRYLQKMSVAISKARIKKVINISSQSVYNQAENILKTEDSKINIENSYAFQKVIIEDLFESIKEFSPLTTVVSLRLPRVIIPSINGQSGFFGKIIREYIEGKTIHIDNPLNNTNLIHVKDVESAINFLINQVEDDKCPSKLNLAGFNISLKEYIELVKLNIEGDGNFEIGLSNEVTNSSMLDGTLINNLGWEPKFSIDSIINEMKF